MNLEGTFKNYNSLLTEYGSVDDGTLDPAFKGFLKKIADQDTKLTNYDPLRKTFDASLIVNGKITFPNGLDKAYMENLSIDLLIPSSVTHNGATEVIFCKTCGLTSPKNLRYDYEPKFTFGDIFDGTCSESADPENVSGTLIITRFCEVDSSGNQTGRKKCPLCKSFTFWEEVENTLP